MSRLLAGLLAQPEEAIGKTIARLEKKTAYPSEDVRFVADNTRLLRAKLSKLGLDPDDTTGEELYYALRAKFDRDCRHIDDALDVDGGISFHKRLDKALQLAAHIADGREAWVLKSASAKGLLKQLPPKRLMKLLGYRSVESMLKREEVAGLFIGAVFCESISWQKKIGAKIARLEPTSFELRPTKLIKLPPERYGSLPFKDKLAASNLLVGAVALCPSELAESSPVLTLALFLGDELEKIPTRTRRKTVYDINPALRWWQGAEHLLHWNDGQPVSLNFKDAAINFSKGHDYENRVSRHAQSSLWEELISRYKRYSENLPVDANPLSAGTADNFAKLLVPQQLALEYSEA